MNALVMIQPAFTEAERLALAGFLALYRGLSREAYALDLRQFTTWCRARSLPLFAVRRADIKSLARDLEARGRSRATVTRRLCTIAGSYKYAVEEELLEHSPAAHVRRPRVDYESHAVGLDRNQLGALLVVAGLGPPPEHALISLLALNGLRVSEATGANIEHLGLERGRRTPSDRHALPGVDRAKRCQPPAESPGHGGHAQRRRGGQPGGQALLRGAAVRQAGRLCAGCRGAPEAPAGDRAGRCRGRGGRGPRQGSDVSGGPGQHSLDGEAAHRPRQVARLHG